LVAFKIKISQGKLVYKLYKLNSKDESIKATIKQMATTEMVHFKMEGTEMPKYNFTDLNGKTYDNTSTKGKIVVLKCWFIHCVACVKEFPDLNNLVQENKNRNDILFISLAMDSKQDLITFLKTKEFKYAVIPETKSFMNDKMHITEYPTHLLIDRNGKIVKVVNRIEDLIPFINKEELKT
jgi:thiol-disulfide isomerase/thioredoxin